MAFTMSSIVKRNHITKSVVNVRVLFATINNMGILSDSIKQALTTYLRIRLKHFGVSGLSENMWQQMIYELLEHCCGKPYTKIGLVDTTANQGEIVYQLKKSLFAGRLKSLYSVDDDVSVNTIYANAKVNPPQRLIRRNIDKAVVEAYFRELEII